ncbi:lipid II:glycine glycyltransferase (peptidoglycan interpeptide bridge formation enzyme) [Pseudonocardia hierapolitana]|uniref:Lipid II:glycine glycyltransferase (Peptidoglycan interpeptide bridge formation enzyme) n=1 Tax=Pseudonocardia hierapolitana TaxID=1128676 RepID=A0A561SVW8_9PSEU|nr:peptidoglycan bridge formation glycyltransferase FemA/FemB family protein [Pseudonocardia hierapolitana]TWF78995.1 lipid II:glycine glycyltransferase (peptidoglycan interpeptide bridge formation enzyme) [Pseudonocardia hierapolitana]
MTGPHVRHESPELDVQIDIGEPGGRPVVLTAGANPGRAAVQEWDRLVDRTPGSDVAQLSAWARIRRAAGFRPLYVFARQEGRLVGGALVLERRLPLIGPIGYVSNGPVVAAGVPRGPVVDVLAAALDSLARTRLRVLFVQPPVGASDVSAELLTRGFRHSESGIAPAASIRIDLTRDIEDLRSGLSRSNRRRSRIWAERGVTVRVGSVDDVPVVAELIARTSEHQHFEPLSLDYIRTLYRELDDDQHVAVFVAEIDGTPAAALLCTPCHDVLRERLRGMDRSDRARKEGVSAATVWHAMLWAKANGYHTYDVGGITADAARILMDGNSDPTSHLTGAQLFKTSFGGEVFLYTEQVERISPALLRLAYDFMKRSRTGGRFLEIVKRTLRGGRAKG